MISWLALSTALCTITSLAVWSRRPTQARGLAVAALLAIVPLSGALLASERGWAVEVLPLIAELPDGDLTVDGFRLVPEQAIYLMLSVDGEPRLFVLPWSAEAASKLQRLGEKGEGIEAKRKKRTGHADDDFPMEIMGTPQPSLPEKQPEAPVLQYEREG